MLKDRFGHEVFVGCTVAYPMDVRYALVLRTGIVTEILPATETRLARLRLQGGTRGRGDKKPLGRRQMTWSDEVIVLGA